MYKKKIIILAAVCLCVIAFAVEMTLIGGNKDGLSSISQVKTSFQSDIQELKDGKYFNLTANDFSTSIEEIEGIYDLQILTNQSYKKRSFVENFSLMLEDNVISLGGNTALEDFWKKSYKDRNLKEDFEVMNEVIDKFFQTEFDKSYLKADFWVADENIEVYYNDFEKVCSDEKYSIAENLSLFGNMTSKGGYMIQMNESLNGTWLSKGNLGDIIPSTNVCKAVYPYLSCECQVEDAILQLADREILLSEMEEKALQYLNTEVFPLPHTEGITYGIGEARLLENGQHDGICFMVRRIYKGVPFEYSATGVGHDYDSSEISYAESELPDTIRGFYGVDGSVVEMQAIKYMLSVGDALEILSNYNEDNVIYEVQGIELVYKSCNVPEERTNKISGIFEPKWKIVTVPENSIYTIIFYVDVVTGEVTLRYE